MSIMKRPVVYFSLLFLFIACKHATTCTNTNPVFDEYDPSDKEYKTELIKQIQQRNPANVHYYVDKYIEQGRKPFMTINIEAEGLCARSILDLKNPNKLKEYKNVKGLTYSGAEIQGLKYQIDSTKGNFNFIFEEGKIVK
jgi:hypothetical protein